MNNKTLLKIAHIAGWVLLIIILFYLISGYAMVKEYGLEHLMHRKSAWSMHKLLAIPLIAALVLHIVPYYIVRKQVKRLLVITGIIIAVSVLGAFLYAHLL